MSDYATLPLEAHNDRSVFLEHAWNVGRAYRNQAMELISICQLLARLAPPKLAHSDAELRRIRRVCDLALLSAVKSGTKVTDEANERFKAATQILSDHSVRRHLLDLPLTIYSKMEIAKWRDRVQTNWSHVKSDEWGRTMTINFMLLRSPILAPDDPETVIVSQELSVRLSLPEILWNFSRYKDRARITLEQNPHFYLRCPADESAYTPTFQRYPLQDASGALKHNDTVYVLFDGPCRVFLEHSKSRIFGNVWLLNGFLIFRDYLGALEGERLVIDSSIRDKWCYCEQPVVYHDPAPHSQLKHRCLRPIVTTPSGDSPTRGAFEDWTVLSRPTSRSINIHIYRSREYLVSTSSLDLPPPPPTSERPGYAVLYTTINTLDDDTLLGIFNYYRLDDENSWNVRLGWCKLSHVSQRWRHLVHSSAFHLAMHILCTNGTPIVNALDHLPPLPLVIDYKYETATISAQDELGIYHALRLRDRVRRIDLHLPPSALHKSITLMNGHFPILEYLSLSFALDKHTGLILPGTFLAPNVRHLILVGVDLTKGLRLLSSTPSLITIALKNIRASRYFLPKQLVAHLRSLPQLEGLIIEFSVPIPRPGAERELLGQRETPVTLPNLKYLTFKGVGAYLDCLVAQIRAPFLERLEITLFNQIAFTLPNLSHFVNITEQIKTAIAKVTFSGDEVSIVMERRSVFVETLILRVVCKQLDWQIDCAAQVCSALMPALSDVEVLKLDVDEEEMPAEWQNGEIDGTTWHELLRSFVGVKELGIHHSLSEELARALEGDEIGLDPGLLPGLQLLRSVRSKEFDVGGLFDSFTRARRIAGRPVRAMYRWHPPAYLRQSGRPFRDPIESRPTHPSPLPASPGLYVLP